MVGKSTALASGSRRSWAYSRLGATSWKSSAETWTSPASTSPAYRCQWCRQYHRQGWHWQQWWWHASHSHQSSQDHPVTRHRGIVIDLDNIVVAASDSENTRSKVIFSLAISRTQRLVPADQVCRWGTFSVFASVYCRLMLFCQLFFLPFTLFVFFLPFVVLFFWQRFLFRPGWSRRQERPVPQRGGAAVPDGRIQHPIGHLCEGRGPGRGVYSCTGVTFGPPT